MFIIKATAHFEPKFTFQNFGPLFVYDGRFRDAGILDRNSNVTVLEEKPDRGQNKWREIEQCFRAMEEHCAVRESEEQAATEAATDCEPLKQGV